MSNKEDVSELHGDEFAEGLEEFADEGEESFEQYRPSRLQAAVQTLLSLTGRVGVQYVMGVIDGLLIAAAIAFLLK